MSGVFQENFTKAFNGNSIHCANNNQPGGISKKRKIEETMDATGERLFIRGRSFLPVRGGCDVFSTEDWKPTGTSLFCPVKQDVYVNLHKYDQITAAQGSFFTADEGGDFQSSVVGHVIHLWRFDKVQRKQYISQSFLFTNQQEFMRVQTFLQNI
ncbi:uncharacterized protein LOC132751220 [Ruditapes philippinarum]|uniref:uncharacterized protein LOC132751220 n=1 Tax=Ruditapes philippinarum TaxID=129788 RepID=UPI00295A750E|nr:uncharacterized protein LOC132751220 [Ruditapes philippinarum]